MNTKTEITKLARVMFERQITIKWLNERTGISRNTLALLKSGKNGNVGINTLSKIASAIECEITDIW